MEEAKNEYRVRNICGGLFIFVGFFGIFIYGILPGIFMMLVGISLLPIFYKKIKLNTKYMQIVLPIILLVILTTIIQNGNNNISETNTNIIQGNKILEITSLKFDESEIELDIKEKKDIILIISPEKANIDNLEFCTSNNEIAILEKTDLYNTEGNINLRIKPISEGICEVYVKSKNEIESNKVTVKVIDNERIEQEEQARKEAEAQAENEKQSTITKNNNSAEKQSTTSTNNSDTVKKPNTSTTSATETNSNNTQGKEVYRTPTGKRYHFDPDCGGKNSYQITLDAAKSAGLTPCKKCAM